MENVQTATAWEYKTVRLEMFEFKDDEIRAAEGILNRFGGDGWEVISIHGPFDKDPDEMPFLFVLMKRPKP